MIKQIYIIGNWKSNKNRQDVQNWFEKLSAAGILAKKIANLDVVVCPTFIHLEIAKNLIEKYQTNIALGAQDVSPFTEGAFTGEISASMLKDYVNYVIIGHSERRKNFAEDDKLLAEKVTRTKEIGLSVIYCVPDENTSIPENVDIIAYEPVWAIGTGKSDTPENAAKVISRIKQNNLNKKVIYGGSVNGENIVSFITQPNIDGVLPGASSLDAEKFSQMIKLAASL